MHAADAASERAEALRPRKLASQFSDLNRDPEPGATFGRGSRRVKPPPPFRATTQCRLLRPLRLCVCWRFALRSDRHDDARVCYGPSYQRVTITKGYAGWHDKETLKGWPLVAYNNVQLLRALCSDYRGDALVCFGPSYQRATITKRDEGWHDKETLKGWPLVTYNNVQLLRALCSDYCGDALLCYRPPYQRATITKRYVVTSDFVLADVSVRSPQNYLFTII